MRKFKLILFIIALSAMAGCIRRPFGELRTEVYLTLKINMEIKQEIDGVEKPELMKVCLCDRKTGEPVYVDYLPPEGGYIYPRPGDYDILVYNINTEYTVIKNENNLHTVEATTNEISEFVKSQLRPFLSARKHAREEAARRKAEEALRQEATKDGAVTKEDTKAPEEKIVNEPDHLFVGRKDNVNIPELEAGQSSNLVIEMDAETIVEVWNVVLKNVEGAQYIRSVSALMTGMVESTMLSDKKDSENPVTVYFQMQVGKDNKSIVATYRTFGKNPLYTNELEIDLNITDTGGNDHYHHFDVTDQFDENEEHLIIVDEKIVIEKPAGGGGFQPSVDDWEDIETDIII